MSAPGTWVLCEGWLNKPSRNLLFPSARRWFRLHACHTPGSIPVLAYFHSPAEDKKPRWQAPISDVTGVSASRSDELS